MSLLFLLLLLVSCSNSSDNKDEGEAQGIAAMEPVEPSYFELRTYYCHPGRLDNLLNRFKDHTMALFEKHGMVNMGYWVPMENPDNRLVYLLGYKNKDQRNKAWEAFINDPDWKSAKSASEEDGPIVDSISNLFMTYTDYSPKWQMGNAGPRIFSRRTYYTNPGKLAALNARFKDHTLKIFENNGMTNVVYFNLDEQHPESDHVLTYFITFPDPEARKSSWQSFSTDPNWKKAYSDSIQEGKLVDTITVDLLVPTDFSPLK